MTERMFMVAADAWATAAAGHDLVVSGAEGRHAVAVVRVRVGETVLLGGSGRRAEAVVTRVDKEGFTARVGEVVERAPRIPRFVLVQALAKGGRDEQAVEAATELGADEVVPWQASRCVVRWRGDKVDRGRQRWEAVVMAATKQSRRAGVPLVAPAATTAEVADRLGTAALGLVLHETASAPLAGVSLPPDGDVVLVVGPEGGVTPQELESFGRAGATAVRLGGEVLRSSTAGPAALAVLSALDRWR